MIYVMATFVWFAFVLSGIGTIVVLEPVWNREAQAVRVRATAGCARRATPRPLPTGGSPRRVSARPLSPCNTLQAA
jgi:hypothetical protein